MPSKLPTMLGHEIVSKIIEIGKNASKFKIGQKNAYHHEILACIILIVILEKKIYADLQT